MRSLFHLGKKKKSPEQGSLGCNDSLPMPGLPGPSSFSVLPHLEMAASAQKRRGKPRD